MTSPENGKMWKHEYKILLLNSRMRLEKDFASKCKKPTVLWEKVLKEIQEVYPTFPFTKDEIYRKFLNLMITYKRIKKRNKLRGVSAASWDYFQMIDDVYGKQCDIVTPKKKHRSFDNIDHTLTADDSMLSDIPSNDPQSESQAHRKQPRIEMLDFLKKAAVDDKKILRELIDIERARLRIEKKKVTLQRKKFKEIKKMRRILKKVVIN